MRKLSILTRCGGLGSKWGVGVCLPRELDDFIIRVQGRGFGGGQWWWSGVFVWPPSLL
jgi:hypothetical protein